MWDDKRAIYIKDFGRWVWDLLPVTGCIDMNFSWVPYKPTVGCFIRNVLPKDTVVPIIQGKLKGKKWVINSSNIECALGSYEYEKVKIFEREVTNSSIVYDIGANVGYYTIMASILVGLDGKVFAFEPLPSNIGYLKKHIYINNCNNIFIIEAAVSDRCGTSQFHESTSNLMGHLSSDGNLLVNTVCIDELIRYNKIPVPSIIKMDIEGAELVALQGLKSTLTHNNIKLFLSTHSSILHIKCIDFLKSLDFKLEPLCGRDLNNASEILAYKS